MQLQVHGILYGIQIFSVNSFKQKFQNVHIYFIA